jgi:hypothetical protein
MSHTLSMINAAHPVPLHSLLQELKHDGFKRGNRRLLPVDGDLDRIEHETIDDSDHALGPELPRIASSISAGCAPARMFLTRRVSGRGCHNARLRRERRGAAVWTTIIDQRPAYKSRLVIGALSLRTDFFKALAAGMHGDLFRHLPPACNDQIDVQGIEFDSVAASSRPFGREDGRAASTEWVQYDVATLRHINPKLSVHDIAREERVSAAYLYSLLRLPWLAPDITKAIINGRKPLQLTAQTLMRLTPRLPAGWAEQRKLLGFR